MDVRDFLTQYASMIITIIALTLVAMCVVAAVALFIMTLWVTKWRNKFIVAKESENACENVPLEKETLRYYFFENRDGIRKDWTDLRNVCIAGISISGACFVAYSVLQYNLGDLAGILQATSAILLIIFGILYSIIHPLSEVDESAQNYANVRQSIIDKLSSFKGKQANEDKFPDALRNAVALRWMQYNTSIVNMDIARDNVDKMDGATLFEWMCLSNSCSDLDSVYFSKKLKSDAARQCAATWNYGDGDEEYTKIVDARNLKFGTPGAHIAQLHKGFVALLVAWGFAFYMALLHATRAISVRNMALIVTLAATSIIFISLQVYWAVIR